MNTTPIMIRIRLMAVAIFSVLITGLSALYLLDSVQNSADATNKHQQELLVAALELEEAHTQFKIQVQEWKNLLLRGKDPEAFQKYFASFNRQTGEVQRHFSNVQPVLNENARKPFDELTKQYQQLVETYSKALAATRLDNAESVQALDSKMQGVDRPLDSAFPELTKQFSQTIQQNMRKDYDDRMTAHYRHVIWIVSCVAVSTILIFMSFWLGIKKPTKLQSKL